MAKMQDHTCQNCGEVFEYLLHGDGDVITCPSCGSTVSSPVPGGHAFHVIVPTYPNSKRVKAGWVHSHGDRPREKISSQVPRVSKP